MIVELDGVGLQAEAHPASLRALFAVDRHLAGKGRVRLAPEEVHDVGRAQRGDRGRHQITPDRLQRRTVGEQDVAGVLGLIDHPPVAGKAGGVMAGSSGLTSAARRSRNGGQSVWANVLHSAVTAAKSSTPVILLSLRR